LELRLTPFIIILVIASFFTDFVDLPVFRASLPEQGWSNRHIGQSFFPVAEEKSQEIYDTGGYYRGDNCNCPSQFIFDLGPASLLYADLLHRQAEAAMI
jgi:hypothetical protein